MPSSRVSTMLPAGRVSAVLFDVGNTLHHLDHAFIAAVVSRLSHPVVAGDVEEAEYAAKAAVDQWFRARRAGDDATRHLSYLEVTLGQLGVRAERTPEILGELQAENERDSIWRVMRPDTPRVIESLRRRGFRLAVVSNADGRVPKAIEASGLSPHFAAVVDSRLVGIEKPDPRIFEIALQACGVPADEAVFVGDIYEIDVAGARGAGMTPILLDPLTRYGDVDCLRIDSLVRLLELLPPAAGQARE